MGRRDAIDHGGAGSVPSASAARVAKSARGV